jgi:REP element-mobilizing transposase RayT
MAPRRGRQIEIAFPCTWGGKRAGAGRKRAAPRPRVPHRTRPRLASRHPVHVTVRVIPGLPRLRGFGPARVLARAFALGCDRGRFRICQFSVQGNHIHLLCEAQGATALARGIQGWKVRVARGLNRRWRRQGSLFEDRYHAVILRTPRQTRNALCYVLQNALRHGEHAPRGVDLFSSAWHFDGWRDERWRRGLDPPECPDGPPTARAATWLLSTGWRRAGGLIAPGEIPRAGAPQPAISEQLGARSMAQG